MSNSRLLPIRCLPMALLLISTVTIYSQTAQQSAGTSLPLNVRYVLDWSDNLFSMTIESPVRVGGANRPAALFHTEQALERERRRLFQEALGAIRFDSSTIMEEQLVANPDLGAYFISVAARGRKTDARQLPDSNRFRITYSYRIHPDLSGGAIVHSRPLPLPGVVGWRPSADFSGIVIYAMNSLPVHGELQQERLRPALFVNLYDDRPQLIMSPEMIPAEQLRNGGAVGYSASTNPDHWQRRVGLNPLRIAAVGVFGKNYTDPIIDRQDALRILSREHNRQLLRDGRIVILVHADFAPEVLTASQ